MSFIIVDWTQTVYVFKLDYVRALVTESSMYSLKRLKLKVYVTNNQLGVMF